jgi:hypothetical protein
MVDLIRGGADRRDDILASLVKLIVLAGNHLRLGGGRWRGRRFAALPSGHARLGTTRRLRTPRRDDLDLWKRGAAAARGRCGLRRCGAAQAKQQ